MRRTRRRSRACTCSPRPSPAASRRRREAEATVTRARATSEAQQITAEGVEREAGAGGGVPRCTSRRCGCENVQRRLEAEAVGIEAKGRRAQEVQRVRDLPGACQAAHRGRARHPHRPGQGDGHRPDRRPHPDVRRRRRHRGQHPSALHVRVRDRGGAGRRGPVPARGGCGIRLARDGIRGIFRRPDDGPLSGHVGHVADSGGSPPRRCARHAVRGGARTAQGGAGAATSRRPAPSRCWAR